MRTQTHSGIAPWLMTKTEQDKDGKCMIIYIRKYIAPRFTSFIDLLRLGGIGCNVMKICRIPATQLKSVKRCLGLVLYLSLAVTLERCQAMASPKLDQMCMYFRSFQHALTVRICISRILKVLKYPSFNVFNMYSSPLISHCIGVCACLCWTLFLHVPSYSETKQGWHTSSSYSKSSIVARFTNSRAACGFVIFLGHLGTEHLIDPFLGGLLDFLLLCLSHAYPGPRDIKRHHKRSMKTESISRITEADRRLKGCYDQNWVPMSGDGHTMSHPRTYHKAISQPWRTY